MNMVLNYIVTQNGFESLEEFHRMVASVPLDSCEKAARFFEWQDNDGTKAGLLKLLEDSDDDNVEM